MSYNIEALQGLLTEIALHIARNDEPDQQLYGLFFQHPEYAFPLIELIHNLEENLSEENPPIYSALLFALDVCVSQLQSAAEMKNKVMAKSLTQLMNRLAELINTHMHSLSYWLPVLNAFYEVHVELTEELKKAYFNLANEEGEEQEDDEFTHLEAIRDLLHELSDLSIFEVAENFFAQSYAMPADFFTDL